MINQWLDRPTGAPPPVWAMPALQAAIETVTVSLYRDKDAPATSVDGILASQFRPAGLDPLIEVQAKLRGVRSRWGVS